MGEIRCTLKQAQDGTAIPLDESTTIIVVPAVAQLTLEGRAFDAGRTFLLPRAVNALNEVFGFATRMQAKHAVVVGHVEQADTEPETLSVARAEIAASWLAGDPAPWLEQYEDSIAEQRRWGAREDKLLLSVALGNMSSPPPNNGEPGDPRVRAFQTLAGVKVDGIAGPVTRGKLVEKYFALSRLASLRGTERPENGITLLPTQIVAHGAGAHFTLKEVSDTKQAAIADAAAQSDSTTTAEPATTATAAAKPESEARIDFMFFFPDAGPDPAPGAADGPEFLEWVKQTELQRAVVVGAPAGATRLFVELWDKQRTTLHRGAKYTLAGAETFSGATNSQGRIEHDDVLPGDYDLTLTLEFFDGTDRISEDYRSSVVVLAGNDEPQVRALGAVPRCELAQLQGLLFDTNKAFLLPSALEDLKTIRSIYEANSPSELLVVGHTDTTGEPSVNDPLSLERAKSTVAFLHDDVDGWLTFYERSTPESRRWGRDEDEHMLAAVLASGGSASVEDQLDEFQRLNAIEEDGVGPLTRKALIQQYMALDGATLDRAQLQIAVTAHGCGENFPLDDTGTQLDEKPVNAKEDALDRRVELFFFDTEFGVVPKPAGENSKKGSRQYPAWRKLAQAHGVIELGKGKDFVEFTITNATTGLPFSEARFRIVFAQNLTFQGRLDRDGRVRLNGVPEGECELDLPDFPDAQLSLKAEEVAT